MFINWRNRELQLNLVYYGAALSGKTTNLEQIHARLKANLRSDLFTLNTHEDRTIFFDFLQLDIGEVGGLKPKFSLYTVPGQVYYAVTRETVLRRADAVVFVVDSDARRLDDNLESWRDMQSNLERLGRALPVVVQWNKRDLPNALPAAELRAALEVGAAPCFEAIAARGVGVPQTLHGAMRVVLAEVQQKLAAARNGVAA